MVQTLRVSMSKAFFCNSLCSDQPRAVLLLRLSAPSHPQASALKGSTGPQPGHRKRSQDVIVTIPLPAYSILAAPRMADGVTVKCRSGHPLRASRMQKTTGLYVYEGGYSLPLKIAAITRGLRRPWNTAKTRNGVFSGAYAMTYSYTTAKRWARCEIRAAIALIGKPHQGADTIEDCRYYPVGGVGVVLGNVCTNFVDIVERFRMKRIAAHACRCRRA
jgi:hypothetical protein